MWSFLQLQLSDLLQVGLLAVAIYYVLSFFRGTRGAQVFLGFLTLVITLILVTHVIKLDVLGWILRTLSVYLAVAMVVIFQPEIRRALAEIGSRPLLSPGNERKPLLENLVQATERLARRKVGMLVAIEREIGLRGYEETGTALDAPLVPELLVSIFIPHTPLHDGGVILRGGRIASAGCIFPLSNQADLHKTLGTRHRAAVGLSEETDAVVVVVSEETGVISLAYRGRLVRGLDAARLQRFLNTLLRSTTLRSRRERIAPLTPVAKEETAFEK